MDPFAAVSLAGNILQFLAAAKYVYKQVTEIRSSVTGITKKNEDMLSLAADLETVAESISAGMQSFHGTLSATEKRIRELGAECQELAIDLQKDIKRRAAKDRSNALRATTSVIIASWKVPEADKKLKKLNELQTTLFKLLSAHMR